MNLTIHQALHMHMHTCTHARVHLKHVARSNRRISLLGPAHLQARCNSHHQGRILPGRPRVFARCQGGSPAGPRQGWCDRRLPTIIATACIPPAPAGDPRGDPNTKHKPKYGLEFRSGWGANPTPC
jgi:hypothetical protein